MHLSFNALLTHSLINYSFIHVLNYLLLIAFIHNYVNSFPR